VTDRLDAVPPEVRTLVGLYLASRVAVEVDRTWLTAQQALPRTGAPLFLVTGWNPGTVRPGRHANDTAHAALHHHLRQAGAQLWAALGGDPGGRHVEPAWAVAGLTEADVLAAGRRSGQLAVFRIEWGTLTVVGCDDQWRVSRPDE